MIVLGWKLVSGTTPATIRVKVLPVQSFMIPDGSLVLDSKLPLMARMQSTKSIWNQGLNRWSLTRIFAGAVAVCLESNLFWSLLLLAELPVSWLYPTATFYTTAPNCFCNSGCKRLSNVIECGRHIKRPYSLVIFDVVELDACLGLCLSLISMLTAIVRNFEECEIKYSQQACTIF